VSESRNPLLPYAAFVALALIWGGSFLFIKLGVGDMGPSALVFIRALSATIALALIVLLTRHRLFGADWKRWIVPYATMAVLNAVLPWTAIAWGEEHISSGLASILNATAALWTAILIFWVIPAERPSPLNYLGVLIGIAGVAILVYPDIAAHGISGSVLGVLAVLAAAFSYALAALYQRTRLRGLNLYEQSFGQTLATAVLAFPIAAPSLPHVHFAPLSFAGVVFLGVFATGVAYLLYYYVMNTLGAVRAVAVTLVVPVTAVTWGVILLHESLSVPVVVGMAVILGGIVLTNIRRTPRRQVAAERESDTAAA
jgi:drug/metabolite transporter (DMT)-like permease